MTIHGFLLNGRHGLRCFVASRHPQNPARPGKVPCEPTKWHEGIIKRTSVLLGDETYSWVMKSNCVENEPGSVFSCYNPKSRERFRI